MVRISIEEAGKQFADCLRQARDGQTVVIAEGEREVAQLVPCQPPGTAGRGEAHARLLERLRRGVHGGGDSFSRDSLYER